MTSLPHRNARRTIGFMAASIGGWFHGMIQEGVTRVARQRGFEVVIVQRPLDDICIIQAGGDLVEGWVALMDSAGVARLARDGRPVIAIGDTAPGVPSVRPDNYQSTRALVRHLIEHGHRRIAFLGPEGNEIIMDFAERLRAYQDELDCAYGAHDPQLILVTDYWGLSGQEPAQRLIEQGMPCTAIVGVTDMVAITAMETITGAGYGVPEDVAIVGFDDLPQAQLIHPSLTTVRQRFLDLGVAATERLLDVLDGVAAPDRTNIPTALIVRRSCGCDNPFKQHLPALGQATNGRDWQPLLSQQLVALLRYPLPPDPSVAPAQIWPGVTTVIGALENALHGWASVTTRALEAACTQAIALSADLDVLNAISDQIEDTMAQALGPSASVAVREQVLGVVRAFRTAMIRARLAYDRHDLQLLNRSVDGNNAISHEILSVTGGELPGLEWMCNTPTQWGCLGLWEGAGDERAIRIARTYRCERLVDRRFTLAAFPPIDELMDLVDPNQPHITMLLPIKTNNNNWGILAFNTVYETDMLTVREPYFLWSDVLGAALDRAVFLSRSEERQRQLHEAYLRERALTDTLREVGSPVIPLLPGVLLVPLIGSIDTTRAQQIISVVLSTVGRERATDILLDVTGVPIVDSRVAGALIQLAHMASLLGARTTLVGVRPEIAQSIIGLGIDLRTLRTRSSLADALVALT
jgi:DNA-binding LacI/PurR family transcriptional regulator/anti-anti-sigma regulatory factor